ncbi:aspartic proteinase CDR1-like [Elaeis guineensis]|uniref:aspartic proteinase CDR1-like n=1 Tax=Elaeis guineensis var. tenera TaxID=51953 RepID=UPI003C6D7F72
MASSSFTLSFLLSLILLLLLPLLASAKQGFSVELIHRDSPKSPLYDPSKTLAEQLREAARRSIARADHLSRVFSDDTYHSRLLPNPIGDYLIEVNVGTPAHKIFAVIDTGSDLTWVNCNPCIGCYPTFEPKSSSTYHRFSCGDNACADFPTHSCGKGLTTCDFALAYADGSHTSGFLATETFTFDTTAGYHVPILNVVFGCSHFTQITIATDTVALVGLGRGDVSLASQLGTIVGKKFSYCLVPPFRDAGSSHISFGANAVVSGPNAVSMPLINGPIRSFYYVPLRSLTLNGQSIPVNSRHVMLDTGAALTMLDSALVQSLEDGLKNIMKLPTVQHPELSLCFDIRSNRNVRYPIITFEFDGVSLTLDVGHVFMFLDANTACLAIISSGDADQPGVIGSRAQVNFHIGYDLDNQKISIAGVNCANL